MAEREYPPFFWKGEQVDKTIGDLMSALCAVEEGDEAAFMQAYVNVNPHAFDNVGYLIGYMEPAQRRTEMWNRFQAQHPIFSGGGEQPTMKKGADDGR